MISDIDFPNIDVLDIETDNSLIKNKILKENGHFLTAAKENASKLAFSSGSKEDLKNSTISISDPNHSSATVNGNRNLSDIIMDIPSNIKDLFTDDNVIIDDLTECVTVNTGKITKLDIEVTKSTCNVETKEIVKIQSTSDLLSTVLETIDNSKLVNGIIENECGINNISTESTDLKAANSVGSKNTSSKNDCKYSYNGKGTEESLLDETNSNSSSKTYEEKVTPNSSDNLKVEDKNETSKKDQSLSKSLIIPKINKTIETVIHVNGYVSHTDDETCKSLQSKNIDISVHPNLPESCAVRKSLDSTLPESNAFEKSKNKEKCPNKMSLVHKQPNTNINSLVKNTPEFLNNDMNSLNNKKNILNIDSSSLDQETNLINTESLSSLVQKPQDWNTASSKVNKLQDLNTDLSSLVQKPQDLNSDSSSVVQKQEFNTNSSKIEKLQDLNSDSSSFLKKKQDLNSDLLSVVKKQDLNTDLPKVEKIQNMNTDSSSLVEKIQDLNPDSSSLVQKQKDPNNDTSKAKILQDKNTDSSSLVQKSKDLNTDSSSLVQKQQDFNTGSSSVVQKQDFSSDSSKVEKLQELNTDSSSLVQKPQDLEIDSSLVVQKQQDFNIDSSKVQKSKDLEDDSSSVVQELQNLNTDSSKVKKLQDLNPSSSSLDKKTQDRSTDSLSLIKNQDINTDSSALVKKQQYFISDSSKVQKQQDLNTDSSSLAHKPTDMNTDSLSLVKQQDLNLDSSSKVQKPLDLNTDLSKVQKPQNLNTDSSLLVQKILDMNTGSSSIVQKPQDINRCTLISDNSLEKVVTNGCPDGIMNETSVKSSVLDGPQEATKIETESCNSGVPEINISADRRGAGIKRPLEKEHDETDEDFPDEKQFKRVKLSSSENNFLNECSSTNEEGNSEYMKALEEGLESSPLESPKEKDQKTNPNKLYQGLLNDVLAEEKDGLKESEVVRTKLKRIKRKDLEDMIIDQLVNKILYDHELGYQKELCKRLEQTLEATNKKALRLTQEVESLKNITLKVSLEHKKRKKELVHPTKVKRSVGIQANKSFISQGFSTAFLPDSDVTLITPSKYQKGKKNPESKHVTRSKGRPKSKVEMVIKEEVVEEEEEHLALVDKLSQKLNSLKEDLMNDLAKDSLEEKPPKKLRSKRTRHSRKMSVNGKKVKTDSESLQSSSSKGDDAVFQSRHPAPLPEYSFKDSDILKGKIPPSPVLRVHLRNKSIILSWNISSKYDESAILSYQLYSYEETNEEPTPDVWQRIGCVKALELPMACTLTQFKCGRMYHFAVRALTSSGREGPFSQPKSLRMPVK